MKPEIVRNISKMVQISDNWTSSVGFVPTMGYLHKGHLSLVKTAKENNKIVVVSIYVNPTQFGPNEDLSSYPRDLDRDIELLSELNVDYVFFPSNVEMYPDNYLTWVNVDKITEILCGASRPSHFKGVTTIVTKLINLVDPDNLYMGEKDFQQLTIIKRMVKDLNMKVNVIGCPLIREPDGLAMSSRNKYLSLDGRKRALSLYNSLMKAKNLFQNNITDAQTVKYEIQKIIANSNGDIDYIEIIDNETLQKVDKLKSGNRILLAVKIDQTRLIDNMEL